MRFLVTGGAGYIGSHTSLRLLEDGHDVIVVDSLVRGHARAIDALRSVGGTRLSFVEADVRDTDRVASALAVGGVDVVLHFAALTYVGESVERPAEYRSVILDGGKSVLEAMRLRGVRRMVFSSTAATYGEPEQDAMPITEATPQRPINPYGTSKLAFEQALREESAVDPTFGAVALRYFNVAGAEAHGRLGEDHRPETHLIPICLEVARGKRPHLSVFGEDYPTPDGTCVRDYVHVEDLVDAHVAALAVLEPGRFRAWNVGIGRGYSVREVVESCRRVTGHPIPAKFVERRAGDPPSLYADPAAIGRDLGWRAKWTDLDEIVRTAWAWMRVHPHGYGD
ncbi:MAG: UDP-glucose 4-epimerase [Planctomycetota bacterium]